MFSTADTSAEVYRNSRAGPKDPTKRSSDRWESDFVWNTNWSASLDRELAQQGRDAEATAPADDGLGLSFSRVDALNDMSIDLSAALLPKKKPATPAKRKRPKLPKRPQVASTMKRRPAALPVRTSSLRGSRRNSAPGNPARAAAGVPALEELNEEQIEALRRERMRYEQLKRETFLWAVAATGTITAGTYALSTPDNALSYAAGALGGLVYLRLLAKSVDQMGDAGDAVGGAVGGQRLLIPVILVLGANRWNVLAADQYGVTVGLLPMLVGFFTYKVAVIGRQVADIIGEARREPAAAADASAASVEGSGEAAVDRVFADKVLRG